MQINDTLIKKEKKKEIRQLAGGHRARAKELCSKIPVDLLGKGMQVCIGTPHSHTHVLSQGGSKLYRVQGPLHAVNRPRPGPDTTSVSGRLSHYCPICAVKGRISLAAGATEAGAGLGSGETSEEAMAMAQVSKMVL